MMAEQTGAGLLGGAALGFGGIALAGGLSDKQQGWDGLGTMALGAVVAAPIGVTVGVKLTGDWRGGNGSWLATGGGAAAGVLLTLATVPSYADHVPWPVAASLATLTMIAPAVIAYHLTTDENADDHAEKRISVPLMMVTF